MSDVMQHAADMVRYNGYSVIKEFYAPDYAVDKSAKEQADNRITLGWRPNILISNLNPRIPVTFYNSDRTKRFKIVVEGMTLDGKMLMIEKLFLNNKNSFSNMIRKSFIVFHFLFILWGLSVSGQKPEDLLTNWSDKSPVEKVYLHLDKDNYIAGETVWFKSYLYSDFYPDTISTTLYVELLNGSSVPISVKILPVVYGNTKGQFELPDTLATGYYFIRAYSLTMLNHSDEFLFKQTIYVSGSKQKLYQFLLRVQ